MHQYDKAVEDHRQAIRLEPNDARAFINLASDLGKKGWSVQAIKEFKEDLRLMKPETAQDHNNFAWLLATIPEAKLREPAKAVELAKKAVEMTPKEGTFWNTLGVAHYRAESWKDAVAALEKSMALRKGGDGFDWFFLAMAHWQLGEKEKARKWYEKAIEWMDKNQKQLEQNKLLDEELRRFKTEAEELLDVKVGPK
jgi:tetratricopeptide (TPR) repeat protein